MNVHESVLQKEVIEQLNIRPNGIYVDCTLGRAGHAKHIASRLSDEGLLIGIDQDFEAISYAKEKLQNYETKLIHANFRHLKHELMKENIKEVDGFLFDLGVSSPQLDNPDRGFSFHSKAKLDMRMDQTQSLTAYNVVNEWTYEQLVKIFFQYGEERFSRQIAKNIVSYRKTEPIETTHMLVDLIKQSIPARARRTGGHPARRIFQAIRIAVNDELNSFIIALNEAAELLKIGGTIVVLTFHSLEDRICKEAFRKWSSPIPTPRGLPIIPEGHEPPFKQLTKKPIVPTQKEIERNRRSRSAKLRAIKKIRKWDERFIYK